MVQHQNSQQQPDAPASFWHTVSRLGPQIRPFAPRLFAGFLCALGAGVVALTIPQVLGQMVKSVLHAGGSTADVWFSVGIVALLGLAEAVLVFFRRIFVITPAARIETNLRVGMYQHLQRLPVAFHDKWGSGQLLSRSMADLGLLRRLRAAGELRRLPVLMLTARAAEAERVEGLETGADDYLTKPFGAAELVARVRALLRRTQPGEVQELSNGPLHIDLAAADARLGEERLHLTRREFDLLAFMTQNAGRVYSRTELLDRVWGADFLGGERTVDQHITQLRSHLGDAPGQPTFLETVRGKGYRMRSLAAPGGRDL